MVIFLSLKWIKYCKLSEFQAWTYQIGMSLSISSLWNAKELLMVCRHVSLLTIIVLMSFLYSLTLISSSTIHTEGISRIQAYLSRKVYTLAQVRNSEAKNKKHNQNQESSFLSPLWLALNILLYMWASFIFTDFILKTQSWKVLHELLWIFISRRIVTLI